jgi:hypothetical protein
MIVGPGTGSKTLCKVRSGSKTNSSRPTTLKLLKLKYSLTDPQCWGGKGRGWSANYLSSSSTVLWYRGEADRTDKSSVERVRGLDSSRLLSCSARRLLRPPPSAALLQSISQSPRTMQQARAEGPVLPGGQNVRRKTEKRPKYFLWPRIFTYQESAEKRSNFIVSLK